MDIIYNGISKISNFLRDFILLFGSLEFVLGIMMSFNGNTGLFISSYLWCINSWNIRSGYDWFYANEGNIQSIKLELKDSIYTRRVLYLEIRGQGAIPLTCTDENLNPRETEQKAVELAYFLRVPIKVF
ncbi:Photosystem I assembly protein Ycf4 [Bienertia sinuspersici]